MKRLTLALLLCAAPAFAASPAVCDKFVASFEKAGKVALKQEMTAESRDFWKQACLKEKEKDAAVRKQTKCLDGAKTEAALGACLK
jgi:hypothetical protein